MLRPKLRITTLCSGLIAGERLRQRAVRRPCFDPTGHGTRKRIAQGRDDEGGSPQIKVRPMRAGVLGEGSHKLHPRGLSRNAGADQRWAAFLLHGRSEILDSTHVEPTHRSILALWQPDCLARDGCTPFEGFTLAEQLMSINGVRW